MEPITLYLMNRKGWSVLSAVVDAFGPEAVNAVVTARDSGMAKDYHEEIVSFCKKNNIQVYDRIYPEIPVSKYKIAIGWRWMIRDDKNLIVLHDSLLPRYRGFAPLVNALINGEQQCGVTALFASGEYDRGDIIDQLSIPISYPVKIAEMIEMVSSLYEKIVVGIVMKLASGEEISGTKQDENSASYSLWREEDDYLIDWNNDAAFLKRFVDAAGFPYKGASTYMDSSLVRITDVEEVQDVKIENRHTGKIIFMHDGMPVVVCGKGLLKITGINNENGKSLLPFGRFRVRFQSFIPAVYPVVAAPAGITKL
jgi:methionyl-tRNA formyltransferase